VHHPASPALTGPPPPVHLFFTSVGVENHSSYLKCGLCGVDGWGGRSNTNRGQGPAPPSRRILFFMLCYITINFIVFHSQDQNSSPANQRCSSKHICDAQGEWDPYAGFETGLCSLVYGTAEAVAAVESETPAAAASATNGQDAKKKD
jgi:hypothetical protein